MKKFTKAEQEYIERLVEKLFSYPDCRNNPACRALKNELFIKLYSMFDEQECKAEGKRDVRRGTDGAEDCWEDGEKEKEATPGEKAGSTDYDDYARDAFLNMWEKEIWSYNPEIKKGFMPFYLKRLSWRKLDIMPKKTLSMDEPIGDGADSGTRGALLADDRDDYTRRTEAAFIVDSMLRLATIVLSIRERKNGTQDTYFRIFFTGDVITLLKKEAEQELVRAFVCRERDLFRAMHLEFLDFCMDRRCRSIPAIVLTPLKRFGELVEGKSMSREPTLPLKNQVIQVFIEKGKIENCSRSMMSKVRKNYNDHWKAIFHGQLM